MVDNAEWWVLAMGGYVERGWMLVGGRPLMIIVGWEWGSVFLPHGTCDGLLLARA